jgi:hypothetical protein
MSARKSSLPAPRAAEKPFNPWSVVTDYGQQQMAVATESAGAMARGFEAMRKIQEQAGNRVAMNHSAAREKMKHAREPAQLVAAQSELLGLDAESTARYWQELGAAALEMQTQMLSCCSHLVDSEAIHHATDAIKDLPAAFTGLNGFLRGASGHDARAA